MDWTLEINQNHVFPPQANQPRVTLVSLARDYQSPSVLEFQQDGTWNSPLYQPDSIVSLKRDGFTIFAGLLDTPSFAVPVNSGSIIRYTAYDYSRLADGITAADANDQPSIDLQPGLLASVVSEFLTKCGAQLAAVGFDSLPRYSGGAHLVQLAPIEIRDESIDSAIKKIAAAAPGVRVFVDFANNVPAYKFVRIHGSPTYDVVIDVSRLDGLDLDVSLDGRAGAVRVTDSANDAASTPAEVQTLSPAWSASESNWDIGAAAQTDPATGKPTALSQVFRLFSFSSFYNSISQSNPVHALIDVPGQSEREEVQIEAIDWKARTVLLRSPAFQVSPPTKIQRVRNPRIKGKSVASNVYLRFVPNDSESANYPGVRFPEAGFSGRAYAWAPRSMARERKFTTPKGMDTTQYARDMFGIVSEPLVKGVVPIVGEPPIEVLLLDRRLNFKSASHGRTNLESLAAPMMGYRLDFAGGVKTDIDFNNDITDITRGGVS